MSPPFWLPSSIYSFELTGNYIHMSACVRVRRIRFDHNDIFDINNTRAVAKRAHLGKHTFENCLLFTYFCTNPSVFNWD